jgi:hypothetical protein
VGGICVIEMPSISNLLQPWLGQVLLSHFLLLRIRRTVKPANGAEIRGIGLGGNTQMLEALNLRRMYVPSVRTQTL